MLKAREIAEHSFHWRLWRPLPCPFQGPAICPPRGFFLAPSHSVCTLWKHSHKDELTAMMIIDSEHGRRSSLLEHGREKKVVGKEVSLGRGCDVLWG